PEPAGTGAGGRRLDNGNGTDILAFGARLGQEQVGMRLQKAAGAELDDRRADGIGHGGSQFSGCGEAAGASSTGGKVVAEQTATVSCTRSVWSSLSVRARNAAVSWRSFSVSKTQPQ